MEFTQKYDNFIRYFKFNPRRITAHLNDFYVFAIFKQNDLYYIYVNGKLLSITWESNGVLFVLGSECELAEYEGDNVILNMLLTKGDESAQIKSAFDTLIQNKLEQAKQ